MQIMMSFSKAIKNLSFSPLPNVKRCHFAEIICKITKKNCELMKLNLCIADELNREKRGSGEVNNDRVPYNRNTVNAGGSAGAFSGGSAGGFSGGNAGGFGGAGFGFPGFPPYGYAAGYAGNNYGGPNFGGPNFGGQNFGGQNFGAPFMPFPFPTYAPMPYDFNSVFQAYINALQSYTQNLQNLQQQFSTQQNQNQNQIAARYAADRYCILAKN
jgi:hypothetical protein